MTTDDARIRPTPARPIEPEPSRERVVVTEPPAMDRWSPEGPADGAEALAEVADEGAVAEVEASGEVEAPGEVPPVEVASVDDRSEPDPSPAAGAAAEEPSAPVPPPEPSWRGGLVPFTVGDPGRAAARTVPKPDWRFPNHPAVVADEVRTDPIDGALALDVRAASVRGLQHRYYRKVRQDSFGYRMTEDRRWLVACVADGVSAGELSHLAADVATDDGVERIVSYLDDGHDPATLPWGQLFRKVSEQIAAVARPHLLADGTDDPDALSPFELAQRCATTVLYALVDTVPDAEGGLAVHLKEQGDTSGWVIRSGGRWEALQAIKNEGEVVASSSVVALPAPPVEVGPGSFTTIGPGDALVLMTDGIGDPLGNTVGEVGDFLAEVWAAPPSVLTFAAHVDFARRTFDDDRTALGIWPAGPPP